MIAEKLRAPKPGRRWRRQLALKSATVLGLIKKLILKLLLEIVPFTKIVLVRLDVIVLKITNNTHDFGRTKNQLT